jgi:hypothetical protein
MAYRVTVRTPGKVERLSAGDLPAALDLAEARARAAAATAPRRTIDVRVRRFEPVQQVAARVEVRGHGARAGLDVRGDGSVEAWTGRLRRALVEPRPGEDAYAALRRAVSGSTSVDP